MTAAAKTISEMTAKAEELAAVAADVELGDVMRDAFSSGTVFDALNRVMRDVLAVGKDGFNESQGYNFRGIDGVVNAVGPAFREHGVIAIPVSTEATYETFNTRSGALMHSCMLTVRFRFYGPAGDFIEAEARGESADSGDKSTPKAHSVAYRTLLLQALCIPTDEPDPDATSYERTVPAPPPPRQFDLARFLTACKQAELDPTDVLAYAEIARPLEELTNEDRPALLAAIKEMARPEEAKEEGP